MNPRRFNKATLAWVAAVMLGGLAAAIDLVRRAEDAGPSDLVQVAVFGGLGILWTLLTFQAGRNRRGRAAIALAPAAYLALLALAQPPVLALVALSILLIDWIAHRRHAFAGTFNLGQTFVSLWAAERACVLMLGHVPDLAGVAVGTLVGGLVYTIVNIALLHVVLWLASGGGARQSGVISYSALANETVVTCFAAMIAMCWAVGPFLLAVPVVPQTLLFLTLSRLEQREGSLRQRQSELQSLQDLGLQVSAQLDVSELGPVVTRIVAEDLHARGALLAMLTDDEHWFEVAACHDAGNTGPAFSRIRRTGFSDEFLAAGRAVRVSPEEVDGYGEFARLGVGGLLAHPLSILGRPSGLLVVYDSGERDPFTDLDCERLASLVRFIEVALNNARLYLDVRTMQEQLIQHEKMSALGQLVSGVAHELNNPLATISGSAELMDDASLPERHARMLTRIRKETERAARIVRNLLTFSRRQKPDLEWASVNDVVRDVAEERLGPCTARGVRLFVETDDEIPPVRIDPYQIHQVVLNLVTNAMHALEANDSGSVIAVRTRRDRGRVQIEVSDNGHGIDEATLDKIFNPFFTTKPIGKGTGLGLSICYGIIQAHEGTIRVRSAPTEGATFTIDLPIPAEAPPEPAAPADSRETAAAEPAALGGRVLVVDDEAGIRSVLGDALTAWGFDVETASSGEEGLEALRRGSFRLAILDLRMPGLDGQGMYHAARADGLEMPPIIFSTGDAASADARAFLEDVDAPVLLKPFSLISLKETVAAQLAERKQPAAV